MNPDRGITAFVPVLLMPETPQPATAAPIAKPDFFVSRTGADAAWAEWIAWQLEAHGYRVVIQDWDFGPGVNFVHKMHQASKNAERTIAVLSPRYFQSSFTEAEWTTAFYRDPDGEKGLLLPVRIERFEPPGMFGPRAHLDLFGLDENTARERLLAWVARAGKPRVKPDRAPAFPGSAKAGESAAGPGPGFPGRLPPIFGLPARNRNFTGRAELLRQLRDRLAADGKAAVTAATRQVATHGLGGVGKSQLAVEYAWRWASSYSRVIWVQAETPQTLGRDFDALADHLRLFPGDKPPEQAAVIAAVRRHLEENPGWLLVFDNVPEPRAVEHAAPRAGGEVIFTSRYTAWGQYAASLRVDVWPPEEAGEFLLERLGAKGTEQDAPERLAAAQVAHELGGLPLALEHAAAYCEQSGLTLADYLPLFRARRLELLRPEALGGGSEMVTVTTTYDLALERIRHDEQGPEAAGLFTLCAFFAPDRIPLGMIREGAEYLGEPLSASLKDELKVNKGVATLLRYSLVAAEGGGAERVLTVHRLVQEVIRERLRQDEKDRWIAAALKIINRAFPFDSDDVRTWPACVRLAPHAFAVLGLAEPREIEPAVTARLLNELGVYSWSRAEYPTAEPLFRRALAIFEKALGPNHPETATSLNNLALLHDAQGRYPEAEPLHQRALAIREKALGLDHPQTATSLNNLAELYRAQGRYLEAEPLYRRALAIREKALGPDHPWTATSLNSLAELYRAQGRYAEAEPLYQRALAIQEKALGPGHPWTATSLNNLALLYCAQGRYAEAEPPYQRALAIQEKALGPDHPWTATSLNNLAGLYCAQGRYPEAKPLYQRALAVREKALGLDHPDTANSINNLAGLYRAQGRHPEAEPLYQHALAISERALGPDHPSTAQSLNNLADLYRAQGRYPEAESLFRRALAIWEKALGPDHPSTAQSLNNLADLYRARGRYAEAEPLYQRALAIQEKALGPDHPDTATSLNNLAMLYRAQGRYPEAERLYLRALAIREKALGPDHPDTATCLNNLAGFYHAQRRYPEAEPLYQHALAIRENVLGPDHPDTATSLNNLAALYRAQGRCPDAEPLYQRALAIWEKALGPDHPSTATARANYAALLRTTGRASEAAVLESKARTSTARSGR